MDGDFLETGRGEVVDLHVEGEVERGEEMTENVQEEVEEGEMSQNVQGEVVDLPPKRLYWCLRKAIPESLAYGLLAHVMVCRTQSDCND